LRAVREFFDEAYRTHDRYWWRQPHIYSTDPDDHAGSLITQLVLRHAASRPPGRMVDLGSGEGADAIRLALMGWRAEAVELTTAGAEKIARFAADAGAEVRVHEMDVLAYEPEGQFDLVICNGVLHYVADKAAACARIQAMTAPGGLNAISLWSTHTPVPDVHRVVPTFPDEERGAVVAAYQEWEKPLMYFDRNRIEESHGEMDVHAHSHIKLIARKPVSAR
jgi:trans-aconitate methyltransferase